MFGSQGLARPPQDEPSSTPSPPPGGQAAAGDEPLTPALLEQVLRRTIEAFDEDEPMDPAEREAICQVFRRHHGEDVAFEVIVAELVGTILRATFPGILPWPPFLEQTSAHVAQSLLADPVANKRLHALRHRIDEVP